ncbi:ABA4-like family protein [Pseudoalteromonas phenolica]|uniref:ABA4-like family protein n=1 Tax=Pseudoalteromonas phenolica TaxID=161398 RepID=UPI001BB115C5|nr:ABA4-like family protein [Pseudoalteromonas phenolica]
MEGYLFNGAISVEALFSFSSQLAMLGWVILIFFPRKLKLLNSIPQYIIPLLLSFTYAILMLIYFFNAPGGFSSFKAVQILFETDSLLLAGWLHFLAFDLFIGAWIARKADDIGMSRLFQAPILFATFMLGPLGLGLFIFIRALFVTSKGPIHA